MGLINTSQILEMSQQPLKEKALAILQEAGIAPPEEDEKESLESKLKASRLDTKSLLQGVSEIASNGDTDNARLQALKMGLQLNPETRQAMKEEAHVHVPVFNIVIKDGGQAQINGILMPRPGTMGQKIEVEQESIAT